MCQMWFGQGVKLPMKTDADLSDRFPLSSSKRFRETSLCNRFVDRVASMSWATMLATRWLGMVVKQ